jgi:glycosyltransferase involved in cell wall biosynthesis
MPLNHPGTTLSTKDAAPRRPRGKFIYITEADISVDNGRGINEREFVQAMVRNHGDEVICVVPRPSRPEALPEGGLECVFPPRGRPSRYPAHVAAAFRRVAELQRRHRIDAVACRLGASPILPYAIRRVLGLPVLPKTLALYALFGTDEEIRASRSRLARSAGLVGRAFAPVYRSLLQDVPMADTVSEAYAEWLHHTFAIPRERLLVIPNGANTEVFTPGDPAAARKELGLERFERIIGYVGSLTMIRHVDRLLRSFRDLADGPATTGLVLVGEGRDRGALEELAVELGVRDRVVFTGAVPYPRVPSYIRAFDVAVDLTLVAMRVGDRVLRTSFSQKIPQYLACGVPVVAWDVDGARFLAAERIGGVARFPEVAALTAVLRALLDLDDDQRRAMGRRARAYAVAHASASGLAARRIEAWRAALARAHA